MGTAYRSVSRSAMTSVNFSRRLEPGLIVWLETRKKETTLARKEPEQETVRRSVR